MRPQLPSMGWKRFVAVATALASLSLLCGSPLRARADLINGHDYLYTSGAPRDVTGYVETIGLNTYLALPEYEEPEPITLDYNGGHIYDETNTLIGFIYSASP